MPFCNFRKKNKQVETKATIVVTSVIPRMEQVVGRTSIPSSTKDRIDGYEVHIDCSVSQVGDGSNIAKGNQIVWVPNPI